jgi:NAD(P)-dependent dehydrogenase (short-subunit alcohol dehydrogenase family)
MADRVALVTGTSSGFGLLASVDLARAGFRVVATMRNLTKQPTLLGEARKAGVDLDVQRLDVTDEASVAAAAEHVLGRYGRIDVLVNNAGYGLAGPVEDMTLDHLRAQLETNVIGVVAVTKAFLPTMRAQRSGRVINVSSMGGRTTFPLFAPYHASKWALEGLSEAWSYELEPFGIDVVLVEPGAHATEFDAGSLAKVVAPESPYLPIVRTMESRQARFRHLMPSARNVSRVIVKAATARRPRFRYPVGVDAHTILPLRALTPWRMHRWITSKMIGVPARMK